MTSTSLAQAKQAYTDGQYEDAVRLSTESMATSEPSGLALRLRGAAFMKLRRWDAARADFARAVELEPEHAQGHYSLGQAEWLGGGLMIPSMMDDEDRARGRRAAAALRRAVELEPIARAWVLLSTILDSLGEVDEASRAAEEARHLDDSLAMPYLRAAKWHEKAGHLHQARAAFSAAIEREPDNWTTFRSRARVHEQLGDREAAVLDLSAALALDPEQISPRSERAKLLRQLGRLTEALADYEALCANYDGSEEHEARGMILERLGRSGEAAAAYATAAQRKKLWEEGGRERAWKKLFPDRD